MEFRLYDRVNCSIFDLIGFHEPDQTKSLGLLFAKSEGSLKVFLKLLGLSVKHYNKYVVDCEPRNFEKKRFDILIRFYYNNIPIEAILIEAKSLNVSNASRSAAIQLKNYTGFNHLAGFNNQSMVTITRDTTLTLLSGIKTITWSQLISTLYEYALKAKDKMASSYVNYLMSIKGNMNYFEEDIISIPAKRSLPAILKSGIYECPIEGKRYARQRKTLYIAFKAELGVMDTLYKLKDIIEGVDLNDPSQIDVLENMKGLKGISQRISDYKANNKDYDPNKHDSKRLFVFDMEKSIKLPNSVRPLENNTNWPYYSLEDFFQPVNSNIGQVVVQKNISINGNQLEIKTNGKKRYDLYSSKNMIKSFTLDDKYTLNPSDSYYINVEGVNKGGHRCKVILSFINNKWNISFKF